jgi:hypothetical protein
LIESTSGLTPADVVLATKFDNRKDGLAAKVISLAAESAIAGKIRPAVAN